MHSNNHAMRVASVCLLAAATFSLSHMASAQSESDVDRTATLRYAWGAPPADLDPPFAKNPYQLMAFALPIYDTLFTQCDRFEEASVRGQAGHAL